MTRAGRAALFGWASGSAERAERLSIDDQLSRRAAEPAPDFDVTTPPEPAIPEGLEKVDEDVVRERPDVKSSMEKTKASRAGLRSKRPLRIQQ